MRFTCKADRAKRLSMCFTQRIYNWKNFGNEELTNDKMDDNTKCDGWSRCRYQPQLCCIHRYQPIGFGGAKASDASKV